MDVPELSALKIWYTISFSVRIVTCMSDDRRGSDLLAALTRNLSALNCSTIVDLQTLQITTAYAKSFQSAVSSPVVPW
jgi:hypothetical protein